MDRICLECKNFWYSEASRGYSEMTPGCDATMDCALGKWDWDKFDDTKATLAAKFRTAATCDKYDPDPELIAIGNKEG